MKKPKPKRKTSFFPSLSSTFFFFFFAQHENQHALLNNSVPSCQERRAAEVKLSARQERIKKGRLQAGVQDDNLSLRGVLEEVLPFVSCSSASLLPDVGALRVIAGPWWRSRLCLCTRVHTHSHITHSRHTLTSHTCMLKWKRSHVDMRTHARTLTLTPIHTHTYTHFPPSSHLQMCSSAGSSRPSFLALGGPMCPTFQLQSLGQ